jgi:hypothetical protein
MGTTCNLGAARETISEVSQGARAAERVSIGANKPNLGSGVDENTPPSPVKKRGVRERAAGILERFAERARPEEDRERRRSLITSPEKPDGPTSGKLPERRRIQTERPATPKPLSPPARAASAATDNARKQNIKNNGRNVPGSQFGQNFGSEQAAKKQAIDAAKNYNKQIYIIKTEGAAKRPYRVVDEDRARVARNGSIVGVVDEKGNHRSIDAPDLTPSEAIEEIKKDVEFGKPMGPNGPSGPKTPKPKDIPEPPSDKRKNAYPAILQHLTQEERDQLDRANKELVKINNERKKIVDRFVDAGSEEDVQRLIERYERHIIELEKSAEVFLKRWRDGEDGAALDYHETGAFIDIDRVAISYAKSGLELVRIKKENLRNAREESDRIQREQEEIDKRAAEIIPEVKPGSAPEVDKPAGPRPVAVGEIFEPPKPQPITTQEPKAPANPLPGVPAEAALEVKALLDPDVIQYSDTRFEVSHGNVVVNGFNVPEPVLIGTAGIGSLDDAIQHLLDGGSLDDVPDFYLRDAILDTTESSAVGAWALRPTDPGRFRTLGDAGGLNNLLAQQSGNVYGGTYIVEDKVTGRKYIVKTPTAFKGEFGNEIYGGYMQQLLGMHSPRIRVAMYDRNGSFNYNLPIVMEHFDDVVKYGIGGRGDDFTSIEQEDNGEITLYDQETLHSASKQLTLLMDEILGNGDRHHENWLYTEAKRDLNVDPVSATVLPIDNGAAGGWGSPLDINRSKFIIQGWVEEDYQVEQQVKRLLARIEVEKAFAALDSMEESILGGDERLGIAARLMDPLAYQAEASDPMVTRIRNFLSAIQELQEEGYLNG